MEQANDTTARAANTGQISIEARVSDLVRLGVIGLFAYWTMRLISPFAVIIVWSSILSIALFPVFSALSRILGNRPVVAATAIVIACLVLIITPLALVAVNFIDAADALVDKLRAGDFSLSAPANIREWPIVGERLYNAWNLIADDLATTAIRFREPIRHLLGIVAARVATIAGGILSFVVSIVLSGIFLTMSDRLATTVQVLAGRIAGDRGVGFARLAGATVRNVSRGVIGVAFLQALLCGICFAAFGIPARGALTFLVLVLCLMQIGPGLVLVPMIAWAFYSWPISTAFALTAVAVPIMIVDNVLKPLLISRGLTTPMAVILIGVIGGTLSYGLLGLFLGPVVLSVFYELLRAWAWPSGVLNVAENAPSAEADQATVRAAK
jgi:predicted PurR-regulated permease PerM